MRNIFNILLAVVVFAACVKQEMPEGWDGRGCPVSFGLQLEYRIDIDGENVAPDEMGDIRIYIFDTDTGVLYDIIELTAEQITTGRIPADLPAGKYDFIAWGTRHDDMKAGGFGDIHMYDAVQQTFDDGVKIGKTTLEDFRMRLGLEGPNASGHYTPSTDDFSDLFYADNRGFTVTGAENQTVPLTFVRNSHTVIVTVSGVQYAVPETTTRAESDCPLQVYITGRNCSFRHDNSICQYSGIVRYERPAQHIIEKDSVACPIRVLRLDKGFHTGTNMMELVVRDRVNDKDIARLDVLDYISRMENDEGELLYPTQQEISREDEFLIPLSFGLVDGVVEITVGDWVIGYYRPTEIIPWIPVEN